MDLYLIGLKQREEEPIYKNNFLPATLHCLINIKFLTDYLSTLKDIDDNQKLKKYIELINEIKDKSTNEENKCISLDKYEDELLKDINKNNYEPQFLLEHLLKEFKSYLLNKFKTSEISDNMNIKLQNTQKCKCKECGKIIECKEEEKLFLEYDLTQNYTNINDCLKNYIEIKEKEVTIKCEGCNKETQHEVKRIYRKLPNVLLIFVKYGEDKKIKNMKINEEISFDGFKNNIHENDKEKKYYLSSLICVRQFKKKNEHFHTFCRKSKKYYCFNGEKIHEVQNINNKLTKEEKDLDDRKERFPYILIYFKKNLKIHSY